MSVRRILLVVGLVALGVWLFRGGSPKIEPGSALVVELGGAYAEVSSPPLVSRLMADAPASLLGLYSELGKAERDDRLGSVVFRVRPLDIGWGKAQEIREAIERLGKAGRRTVAWLELERFGPNLEYYVASAADEVWVAPGSRNPLVGLAAEYLFLGGLFEKLGVEIEYERIGRYKTAVESYAEQKMSVPNREMTTALLDSLESQLLAGIAEGRGLTPDAVSEAIDAAPVSAAELQALDLVDGAGFFEDVLEAIGDPPRVEAAEYARVSGGDVGHDPVGTLAIVYGTGPVMTGKGGASPLQGAVLAADTVAEALEAAAADSEVKGILFRIDSPGGSALASDVVWHAVARAREAGKPVVASFSDVAASGGYYVAAGADRIVAHPATYTGSIGVFVLRPALGGLLEKLGIGVETMTRGSHADLLLSSQTLSPRTRARLRADVQGVYELFVSRVADGRGLSTEEVDSVGRGRVFTGSQAAEAGLVDRLGGLRAALEELKVAAGLDAEADVILVTYPPPKPLVAQLQELAGVALAAPGLEAFAKALGVPAGLQGLARLPAGVPLLVPPVVPRIH